MFKKVLIANRGEIAVRIIRACHELGIEAVVIYSEPDRTSLHVQLAEEAYLVGKAQSSESYLKQDRILKIAKESGVDAIHPGYGFLAENAVFARSVEQAGIKFIGPKSKSIELMGDKTKARILAKELGVPTIPGSIEPIVDLEAANEIAKKLGFPVLLKAAAGGGGKGMRIVNEKSEFQSAFRGSQNEARSAFGDDRIYLEKYLVKPRHIEFQIIADSHGNTIHLLERECSIQRRHQKLVEESPCVGLTSELREKMGESAIELAKAANYENAGTIEFLVDAEWNYYFLEMNTRLQVEHPVTEAITGIDLVKEQLKIANGDKLEIIQKDVTANGHAIECRICSEDPRNNFMPSTGKIEYLFEPDGFGVRCDSGIYGGAQIYPYYDPLMAKLIVWGKTRNDAIDRMKRALKEYQVFGVDTCIPYFIELMDNEKFKMGEITTQFVEQENIMDLKDGDETIHFAGAVSSSLFHSTNQENGQRKMRSSTQRNMENWRRIGRLEGFSKP